MSAKTIEVHDSATLVDNNVQKVCFVGSGYVGALTAIVIALNNPEILVNVVDKNPSLIAAWNSDNLPIAEPRLESILFQTSVEDTGSEAIGTNGSNNTISINGSSNSSYQTGEQNQRRQRLPNISFSTNVREMVETSEIIFLCVDTPLLEEDNENALDLDTRNLEAVARTIADVATDHKIVVEKSTAPCGTAERILNILATYSRPSASFSVLSSPEFLAQGNAVRDLLSPSRVIIGELLEGSDSNAVTSLTKLYTPWVPASRIITTDAWSSELSKLASNAFVAQRISSINSLSAICEATNANVEEVSRSIGLDPRIGPFALQTGLGFGGSCLRKDISCLVYLAQRLGLPEVAEYWKSVTKLNEYQNTRVPQRVIAHLRHPLGGQKVAVLGFSFKKNTSDTRNTTAIAMVRIFLKAGLDVSVYDPHVSSEQIRQELKMEPISASCPGTLILANDLVTACNNSSGIVIHTDWDEFARDGRVDWLNVALAMQPPKLFLNAPGATDALQMERYGFNVLQIGKRHRNDQLSSVNAEHHE